MAEKLSRFEKILPRQVQVLFHLLQVREGNQGDDLHHKLDRKAEQGLQEGYKHEGRNAKPASRHPAHGNGGAKCRYLQVPNL